MSEKGRPLPKFGEWDANDPASAEGFTVIFNKARDERKTGSNGRETNSSGKETNYKNGYTPKQTLGNGFAAWHQLTSRIVMGASHLEVFYI